MTGPGGSCQSHGGGCHGRRLDRLTMCLIVGAAPVYPHGQPPVVSVNVSSSQGSEPVRALVKVDLNVRAIV